MRIQGYTGCMSDGQKTILVIDDEALVRQLYAVKFQNAGYKVLEAEDGEKGLAAALASKPDVIVLDIMMPRMDGYETLKRLRASGEWGAQAPVIVLTNNELDRGDEFATIDATAPAYFLMKTDVTPGDVLTKIESLFE